MPTPAPWTLVRLERACRKAFMERGRLKMKALSRVSAQVEWTEGGPIKAEIDPLTVSHIAGVVHELAHTVLYREMQCFAEYRRNAHGEMEEDLGELAMNAWEEALLKHISSHKRRKEWWRKAINGKVRK